MIDVRRPWSALVVAVGIVLVGSVVCPLIIFALWPEGFGGQQPGLWNAPQPIGVVLVQQVLISVLVVAACGAQWRERLALSRGAGIDRIISAACFVACIMWLLHASAPWLRGSAQIWQAAPSTWPSAPWLVLLSMVVGAPFAEEFLLRGLLFPALARAPIGAAGAAGLTSAGWAALHASFPWPGIATIFVFGLLLAFARVRTGSLWSCILAHALFNAVPALAFVLYGSG